MCQRTKDNGNSNLVRLSKWWEGGGGENPQFIKETDRSLGRAAARSVVHSFSSQFERQLSSRSEVKQAKMVPIYFSAIRTDKTNATLKHLWTMCRQHPKPHADTTMKCGKQCMTVRYEKHVFRRWFMFTDWREKICT